MLRLRVDELAAWSTLCGLLRDEDPEKMKGTGTYLNARLH